MNPEELTPCLPDLTPDESSPMCHIVDTVDIADIVDIADTVDTAHRVDRGLHESDFVALPYGAQEAVSQWLPQRHHQNHEALFALAREKLAIEAKEDRSLDETECRALFNLWYEQNEYLAPDNTRNDYWLEFEDACESAIYPAGADIVEDAWQRAQSQPPPEDAALLEDDDGMLRLIALCRELARPHPEKMFTLSYYQMRDLLGKKHQKQTERMMKKWRKLGLVKLVEPGTPFAKSRRANRYQYLGQFD